MTVPPHVRLLLDALGVADAASFRQYQPEDWHAAAALAMRAGVAPLLYHRLHSLAPQPDIPAEVSDQLRRIYLASVVRMARQFEQYGRVLGALRAAGIPVIVLKGGHLGECVYRNIAVRAMSDLDILVHETDLDQVATILAQLEYYPQLPHQVRFKARAGHHWNFVRRKTLLTVIEAHWTLLDPRLGIEVDDSGLWDRATEARIAGAPVSVLSPPDLLLHLCLHAAVHSYNIGLRMGCDIAEVLRVFGEEMDWDGLVSRAHQWKASRSLCAGLWLAREAFRLQIPEAVVASLDPLGLGVSRQRQLLGCILTQGMSVEAPGLPGETVGRFWATRGWHRKIGFLLRRILLPAEDIASMYPAAPGSIKILLYYPARIRDLVRRHGRIVWRLLTKDKPSLERAARQTESNSLKDWLLSH